MLSWVCFGGRVVLAAGVSAQVSARETYVGVPITLRVTVEGSENPPEPQIPAIPDVQVDAAGGPQTSSRTTIINGQMSQRTTVAYDYRVTPSKTGSFTIPTIEVKVDGGDYRTQPITVVVSESENNDDLFVEVTGARPTVYVGESLPVTLTIYLKPFVDRRYNYRMTAQDMWSCIDLDASSFGAFLDPLREMASRRQWPGGREVLRPDRKGEKRAYYAYEIQTQFTPQRPGALDVGDVRIVVSYPEALGRQRDFFGMGNLTITQSRPVSAAVAAAPIEVKSIPTKGRPAFYRDAVGQYTIQAAAKPTTVAVGDPITLMLTIRGDGDLDVLQPPPLAAIPTLTESFKVPAGPLAGQVDGKKKTFTQTVRAKSERVTAIPAIPFAYFDPQREQFVTVTTEPIPITVTAAKTLASGAIVDAAAGQPGVRGLTEAAGGILANYTGTSELLSSQTLSLGRVTLATLALLPVAFAICWFVRRHQVRLQTDASFARQRTARRRAQQRLSAARSQSDAERAAASGVALMGYVADRCNLPEGGLTRADVVAQLSARRVGDDVRQSVDDVLARCEQWRYAGSAGSEADGLVDAASACIKRLERERF